MSKLIIMRGLPGSGKSTKAIELLKQGDTVRLNRDLLRTMLHNDKWNGKNENLTKEAEHVLAKLFLTENKNVIIDDTNINPKILEEWKAFHTRTQVIDLTGVPVEECVKRDMLREKQVGKSVIVNMARRYDLYKNEKMDVIVDIDGTLADLTHRLHFLEGEKKDWKSFFANMAKDVARWDIVAKVIELAKDYNIVLVSGRPEDYRAVTEAWLNANGIWEYVQTLIMRSKGDSRQDDLVKQDILNNYFDKSKIFKVIDDRPRVIRMWRENGLEVEDVGKGVEF